MLIENLKNKFLYSFGLINSNDRNVIKELIIHGIELKPAIYGIGGYPSRFEIQHGYVNKLRILDIGNDSPLDNDALELISKLRSLEVLIITMGKISSLPECLSKLTELKQIHVIAQNLSEFPIVLTKLKRLRVLELSYNNISSIPIEISNLRYLEKLMLHENKIKKIPDSIGKLVNIEYISLYNNEIEVINTNLFNLGNLTSLDLSNNKISSIPKEIGNLMNLKELSFANRKFYDEYVITKPDYNCNSISNIPLEMIRLHNLDILLLDNNPILKSVGLESYQKLSASKKINYLIDYQSNFIIEQKERIFEEVRYVISEEDASLLRELIDSSKKDSSKNREFINKIDDLNNLYGFGKNISEIIKLISQAF